MFETSLFWDRFAESIERFEVERQGLFSVLDGLFVGFTPRIADGVDGDELLNLWLVAHDGIAIRLRCRDDEVPVEVLSLRLIVGELPGPRLGA